MRLGEILIRRKLVTVRQLKLAIQIQQMNHQQIGKILIACHFISSQQLERSLQEQYWRTQHKWIID